MLARADLCHGGWLYAEVDLETGGLLSPRRRGTCMVVARDSAGSDVPGQTLAQFVRAAVPGVAAASDDPGVTYRNQPWKLKLTP